MNYNFSEDIKSIREILGVFSKRISGKAWSRAGDCFKSYQMKKRNWKDSIKYLEE